MNGPILLFVAHPDDEALSLTALMHQEHSRILHVQATDGAPRNLRYAQAAGFATREEYAEARRREKLAALALVEVAPEQCMELGYADQDTPYQLVELTRKVEQLIQRHQPSCVYTHPYEGGHPDHDACAFAVHWAHERLGRPCELWEFACYHAGSTGIAVGKFLPYEGAVAVVRTLTPEERERKQRLMNCYASQAHVLRQFPLHAEQRRLAPAYDFVQPPHSGPLYYETRPMGMQGVEFRRLVQQALREGESRMVR